MPPRLRLLLLLVVAVSLLVMRDLQPPAPSNHNAFGRGPSVVLVHGLGSRAAHWLPTARLLARRYRVTLVDLPGHGLTSMPDPFSLERAALGLDLALREEARGPVILVGHSLGGLVATAAALEHPERVRGLVLVETALRPQVEPNDRAAMLAELDRNYPALLHAAYLGFGRDSAQGERLYAEVKPLDPEIVKRWIRLAWTADLSAAVAGLGVPVMAVLAERSWPKDEPLAETSAVLGYSRIPRLQATRLEDCGHFLMLDRPKDLAAIIDRFASFIGDSLVAIR
ncbi:MAG TPA: alpha/beta hydrolase [Candidatus Limnocylindria bacterium]|nr:alpha/beta hydrolase [Candidatus Limnocylindria bacterium]